MAGRSSAGSVIAAGLTPCQALAGRRPLDPAVPASHLLGASWLVVNSPPWGAVSAEQAKDIASCAQRGCVRSEERGDPSQGAASGRWWVWPGGDSDSCRRIRRCWGRGDRHPRLSSHPLWVRVAAPCGTASPSYIPKGAPPGLSRPCGRGREGLMVASYMVACPHTEQNITLRLRGFRAGHPSVLARCGQERPCSFPGRGGGVMRSGGRWAARLVCAPGLVHLSRHRRTAGYSPAAAAPAPPHSPSARAPGSRLTAQHDQPHALPARSDTAIR